METMRAKALADGQPALPSAEIVSKVLSQNSSNTTFLKNANIATPSSKSPSAGEEALREELAAERQGSAVLHQKLEELKKRSEENDEALTRTQRQYEELKKQQEDSKRILSQLLTRNNPGISSQP
jgi:DNA repair exonuclease SbcCD ATPase subunit